MSVIEGIKTLTETLTEKVEGADEIRNESVAKANDKFKATKAKAKEDFDKGLKKLANAEFENGATVLEFAEALGKAEATTRAKLKDLGVSVPEGKRGVKSKFSEDEKLAIAEQWVAAETQVEIFQLAAEHGINPATMRQWAIAEGLFTPKTRKVETEVEVTELQDA